MGAYGLDPFGSGMGTNDGDLVNTVVNTQVAYSSEKFLTS
jgi:hypothetical protein